MPFLKRDTHAECEKDPELRDKENKEVWNTFKQISKEPAQCLGAYVISMTSKASDILSVYFLQKQAQTKNLLRVVPLFETLDDLKNAKDENPVEISLILNLQADDDNNFYSNNQGFFDAHSEVENGELVIDDETLNN